MTPNSQNFNTARRSNFIKTLVLSIAFSLVSFFSFSQDSGFAVTVTIDNVKNNEGKVAFSLHTKDTFMKGNGIMNTESEIKDGKVTITFENVSPGEYAIMALHDENNNQKMDYRENGMPSEDYGMSNNVMSFGPPVYDDAKFKVENKDIELNIRF